MRFVRLWGLLLGAFCSSAAIFAPTATAAQAPAPPASSSLQNAGHDLEVIPLWPGNPPGTANWSAPEKVFIAKDGTRFVQNVTVPTLTVYPPQGKANGTAVVICPGGAYHFLAIDYEGNDVARWLNSFGVTAFVLKYRVYPTGDDPLNEVQALLAGKSELHEHLKIAVPVADEDGRQGIRIVRQRAAKWGIDPDRIMLMGFSAGGGVTVDVALKHDAESRPDFAAPIYPVIPADFQVPADAPPLFIAAANDDPLLNPVQHSVRLYTAWSNAGKSAELHVYSEGGHGFGMKTKHLPVDSWRDRLMDWMILKHLSSRGF